AAIASLLGIVDLKKADGIVLATDQVPTLLIGGGRSPLTMPPMSASLVESALAELLTPELRAALGSTGHVETPHTSGNRGTFNVRVRVEDGTTTVTLEKGDARIAPEPSVARPAVAARPDDREPAPVAAALDHAMGRRASDVLLSTGLRPRVRVQGEWVEVEAPPVTAAHLQRAPPRPARASGRRARPGGGGGTPPFFRRDRQRRPGVRPPRSAHRRRRPLPRQPLSPADRPGGGAASAVDDAAQPGGSAPAGRAAAHHEPASRAGRDDRGHRLGQVDDAPGAARSCQPHARLPHRHPRGSRRVPLPARSRRHPPA